MMIITDQDTWHKFAEAATEHETIDIFGAKFYVSMVSKRSDTIFGFHGEVLLREVRFVYLPFDLAAAKRGDPVDCRFDGIWHAMHFYGESRLKPGYIVVDPLQHIAGMQQPTEYRIGPDVRMGIKL